MTKIDSRSLSALVPGLQALFLDFDGPVCSVFAGLPAASVASHLREIVERRLGGLPASIANEDDPLQILRSVPALGMPRLTDEVSRVMRNAEQTAVATATETPHITTVLKVASEHDLQLAIVSNNSLEAISSYLQRIGLNTSIPVIVGRTARMDLAQLKPSPYLLIEALAQTRVSAEATLFVGDSTSDIHAGHSAGIRVIGFANRPQKVAALATAGADAVIETMADLAAAIGCVGQRQIT